MHTRFFDNEFGHPIAVTTFKTPVQSLRNDPVEGICLEVKSGNAKIINTTLTRTEAIRLARSILKDLRQ
jgi:hypothetical protein